MIVYANDPTDADKHAKARTLLDDLIHRNEFVTSVQVLNELYVALTRPHKSPSFSHNRAVEILHLISATSQVFPLTQAITFRALDAVERYKMHYWDAVLWATARENGISVIYTEDTPGASVIEGVRYINPFAGGG